MRVLLLSLALTGCAGGVPPWWYAHKPIHTVPERTIPVCDDMGHCEEVKQSKIHEKLERL